MEIRTEEEIKRVIRTQLPRLMETDPDIRDFIVRVTRERFAEKKETESKFDRIMEELKAHREAQQRELTAWEARWAEERAEDKKKWEAQEKKWGENQRVINDLLVSVKAISQKLDSSIGALGARWGLHSEASFRNGLKAILEDSFGVKVIRYEDYDSKGKVFGRPDQIEMDIIIHNGTLILCEIKSSMSKSDLYAFWRKKNFYEEKHECKATRSMVISPMIDDKARAVAKELGIEMYSYADSVEI